MHVKYSQLAESLFYITQKVLLVEIILGFVKRKRLYISLLLIAPGMVFQVRGCRLLGIFY